MGRFSYKSRRRYLFIWIWVTAVALLYLFNLRRNTYPTIVRHSISDSQLQHAVEASQDQQQQQQQLQQQQHHHHDHNHDHQEQSIKTVDPAPDPRQRSPDSCETNIDWLRFRQYGLTKEIVYQRRRIIGRRRPDVQRNEVAELQQPLVRQGQSVNLDDCEGWTPTVEEPTVLDVPLPFPRHDLRHIILGVATTYERLEQSMPQMTHWLRNTNTRLVAVIIDANNHYDELGRLSAQYASYGVDLMINGPWNDAIGPNEHHFTILRNLLYNVNPDTKWVGILDDDTFFPSLIPLAEALSGFDHTQPWYLGGISENLWAVNHFGMMAYGGAGVFLSLPLANEVSPWVEECLEETQEDQGDGLLRHCIYTHTEHRFSSLAGLHQIDMGGDLSGFYESGVEPITLHHWKSWHSAPVLQMAQVGTACGNCFLQRWRAGDDTVFTNGYSITVYQNGAKHLNLTMMENTWGDEELFEWSMGPFRERENAKRYHLIDSEFVETGQLRQIYVYRAQYDLSDQNPEVQERLTRDPPKDEVVELFWSWDD